MKWQEWQESPWGRLRYSLALANVLRHIGDEPLRVLDIGGGNGGDAVELARLGHHVTIVDSSAEMLADAVERAAEAEVVFETIQADAFALPAAVAEGDFDVVLCHNLVQYLDDVTGLFQVLLAASKAGGLLSIIAMNHHSEPMIQAVRELDLDAALAALDSDQATTVLFDKPITLHTAGGLTLKLAELGCVVTGHYGIRAICDYIVDNDVKHDPEFFAKLEAFEHAVTDRAPYKHTARNFQLTALKPA
jgi:S-adenosylmethionine-dependent methyltransferase